MAPFVEIEMRPPSLPFRTALLGIFLTLCIASGTAPVAALDRGPERGSPKLIILHAIGGPECRNGAPYFARVRGDAIFWADWLRRHPVLGIHYVVDREGRVIAGVPESEVANHARGYNQVSLGIELVNDGDGLDPYPPAQVEALIALLRDIRARHALGPEAITTHSAVNRGERLPCGMARKVDPGPALDIARVVRDSAP